MGEIKGTSRLLMGSLRKLSKQKNQQARYEVRRNQYDHIGCLDWNTIPYKYQKEAKEQIKTTELLGSYESVLNIPERYDELKVFTWDSSSNYPYEWTSSTFETVKTKKLEFKEQEETD